jgi:cytidine deaminase
MSLVARARKALKHAYSPYSGVKVGACALSRSGEVFCGVNVENGSYGLTVCAERNAIFAAAARGHREIEAVAVAAEGLERPYPCGACLQVMAEFGVERVLVDGPGEEMETFTLADLLPRPFRL